MSETSKNANIATLSDESFLILQQLADIHQIDDLITLCCSTLNASVFIHDPLGNVLVHSSFEDSPCPSWAERLKQGHVQNTQYVDSRNLRPISNTMKHAKCRINGCTRLYFPLRTENALRPNVLNIFIWSAEVGPREQSLAAIFAGAFSSLMLRRDSSPISVHQRQTLLLRNLIDYKAGLKPYYLRSLSQCNLQEHTAPYRVSCIPLEDSQQQQANLLVLDLAHRLPQAWCFLHSGYLLAVFNEGSLPLKAMQEALAPYLAQQRMTACLSMPFYDLLRLRYMFEDCRSILPIAARKEPGACIHLAERYQCTAFLSRCQQYFPLQDYYPESLTRLMEYDQETGRSYLTTLTAYLENNMNANAAAKSIFMHRNTMMQQIEKIEQIMGISLEDKEMCLYLQLCLKIHELLHL